MLVPMRIAILSYFGSEISATTPSGVEAFTYTLVEELRKRSDIASIDVYGVGSDHISGGNVHFIPVISTTTKQLLDENPFLVDSPDKAQLFPKVLQGLAVKAYQLIGEKNYDLIHNNSTNYLYPALAKHLKAPVVTTLHTVVTTAGIIVPAALQLYPSGNSNNYFTTITTYQAEQLKHHSLNLTSYKTIYNGINAGNFAFVPDTLSTSYGIWVGRISGADNKGLKEAILASTALKKDLTVISIISDTHFYETEIAPLMERVRFIDGQDVPVAQKASIYGKAAYLLYPLQWEEPFGIVFLEAMACGTPVISFARGGAGEIVEDGVTGFIVNPSDQDIRGDWVIKKTGQAGLEEAISRLASLSPQEYAAMRQQCRARVEKLFSSDTMASQYHQLYQEIVQKNS